MKTLDIFAPQEQPIYVAEKKATGIGLLRNRVARSRANNVAFSLPAALNGGLVGELRLAGSLMRFPVDQSCQAAAPNWSSLRRFPNRTAWSHIMKFLLLFLACGAAQAADTHVLTIELRDPAAKPQTVNYPPMSKVKCERAKADDLKALAIEPRGYRLVSAKCLPAGGVQ
jgi:hypothetical protein